jgi:hypothetical protein
MWCSLCARQSEPGDRGWISVLLRDEAEKKPLVVTYCPECIKHAVELGPVDPEADA